MRKVFTTALLAGILMIAMALPAFANGNSGDSNGRAGDGSLKVTVLSSGLTFDSIIKADVPMNGPFQQRIPTAAGLTTAYGPGDVGYLGGRWKFDSNGDGTIDKYFICPLLGPGFEDLP